MPENVTIKGIDDRLEIHFSGFASYEELKRELIKRLDVSREFFRDSDAKVVINACSLTEEQREEIKSTVSGELNISKVFFSDEDYSADADSAADKDAPQKTAFQNLTIEKPWPESGRMYDSQSVFIVRDIKTDEHIVCSGDIVVVGDIEAGAELIAGGSIAVFGKLCGSARAGAFGRTDVCVAAIYMSAEQIRVSGVDAVFGKKERAVGEVAELKHGAVTIRPVSGVPGKKSFAGRFKALFKE